MIRRSLGASLVCGLASTTEQIAPFIGYHFRAASLSLFLYQEVFSEMKFTILLHIPMALVVDEEASLFEWDW